MPLPTHPRESYTVGIICALDVEKAAVEATLDEEHGGVGKMAGDDNSYNFGRIGQHDVVVACLPAGMMGKASAAMVAKDMMRSFPIKAGFMVGIGGGVWSDKADVRLGDVVVSQPDGMHGGVVQWDFGKMEERGFRRTGTLNKPPRPLLNAVQSLKATHRRKGSAVHQYLTDMMKNNPYMKDEYTSPGREHDELFEASCNHPSGATCAQCDRSRLNQERPRRIDDKPQIHYGNIASGDEVMKDVATRDRIAREEGILCFEMEAAGLMDSFPCVVIRPICDYADSHKNKQWQPYAAATAACYCKELSGVVDRQGIVELELASHHIEFSLKDIPVTDYFVPRPLEMAQLEAFLNCPQEKSRRRVYLVHGLGGMGKTQLCVEYVRTHHDNFTAVLWLDGSSRDALRQSLASAAQRLPVDQGMVPPQPHLQAHDIDESIDKLWRWLSKKENTGWPLIFDNVDRDWQTGKGDAQAYNPTEFFPSADHGAVSITSRLTRLQGPQSSLHLRQADQELGKSNLETRARKGLPDADRLVQRLGGLPLALVQAGAYLQQTGMTVDEYLGWYASTWENLMKNQNLFPLHEYGERGVLTTWRMSYEQVCAVKPEAARLLDQWAFLHPGDIWYDIAEACCTASAQSSIPYDETSTAPDKLSFWDSLHILAQYSLISATGSSNNFAIHPVVHDWSLHNITDQATKGQLSATAIWAIADCVPQSGSTALRGYEEDEEDEEDEETWELKHILTLDTVNNLGNLYRIQGKMKDAEEMYLRALTGYEEALGPKHTSTLNTVHNLGLLYAHQGKMKDAEDMFLRALRGKEEAWVPKHTSTLETVNNLAVLYYAQGKMQEAEEMYLRALRGFEEARGPKHTSTLSTVNNLAALYYAQGKMHEAEQMYLRALTGMEEALGPKHTSTLDTVYNLGIFYSDQGRMQEAEEMCARALQGYRNVEGDHEADIEYLQGQLETLQAARQTSSQHLQSESRNPGAEISSDVVAQNDRTARMRDFVLRVLMQP
ncbi:hypothetical protein LTR22_027630 [Elasticomyces elasticus]|nr:hypothetical protein LTR22_027630 [Elasticomyces elasticus]